jgi:cytochrome c5
MKKVYSVSVFLAVALLLMSILLSACGQASSTGSTSSSSTPGGTLDGQTLMQERCSVCHSLARVESAQKTANQWKTTVDQMIARGAQLTPDEETTLVNYLAQTYHP